MKRNIIRILLASLAATGCVDERRDVYDPTVLLAFQPAMYASVRAAADDAEEYPSGTTFGISAWSLPDDRRWETDAQQADPWLTDARIVPVKSDDGTPADTFGWMPETPRDWPSRQLRLTFAGWAPYAAATRCTRDEGVVFEGFDASADQTDLLYTEPLADRTKFDNGGVVATTFHHALAAVAFRVKSTAASERIVVRSVRLTSVCLRGDFRSLPAPAWTLDESRQPLLFFSGGLELDEQPAAAGGRLLIPPQQLACPVEVVLDRTLGDATETVTLRTRDVATLLEAGRHYTYTLSIDGSEVIFTLENIDRFKS